MAAFIPGVTVPSASALNIRRNRNAVSNATPPRPAAARTSLVCSAASSAPAPLSRRSFVATSLAAFTAATLLPSPSPAAATPTAATPAMSAPQIIEVTVGTGASPTKGAKLFLHYTLTLNGFQDAGGQVVDSSRTRGSLFSYAFDTGAVIRGWDMGVATMKVGGTRRLIIPSELGYGQRGAPGAIPPNSTLYFDIELVRIG